MEMGKYSLTWIDKDAEVGPLFRIGEKDIYSRERAGERIIRLKAIHSPNLDYLTPAVEAFHEISEHWGAPAIFIIDPDVRKPPAGQFLYEWSQAAWHNGSVDQSYMVMHNALTQVLGRFVCRMFCQAGMPFDAISGDKKMQKILDEANTTVGWENFELRPLSTALVAQRRLGEGAYGQIFARLFGRFRNA